MIDIAVSGVKLTLRYEKGSYSYARLDPESSGEALYETARALNSLQAERAKSVGQTTVLRFIDMG